jgi:hypothetical protein
MMISPMSPYQLRSLKSRSRATCAAATSWPATKEMAARRVANSLKAGLVYSAFRICQSMLAGSKPEGEHLLAHGDQLPHDKERFGGAFRDAIAGEKDIVNGVRLAKALGCRPGYPATSHRHAGPAIVTLAAEA